MPPGCVTKASASDPRVGAGLDPESRQAAFETLIKYVYRMRHAKLIHAYALYRDMHKRDKNVSILTPLSPSLLAILVTFLGFSRRGLSEMFRGGSLAR